jgi:type IV pilus assembly protein PilA
MTCQHCGATNAPSVAFCARCGQRLASAGAGPRTRLATTAMVLGIISYPLICAVGLGFLTALAAIVCGIVALVKTNRDPQQFGGKPSAISGLVLGGLVFILIPVWGIVAAIAIPSLLRARISANEAAAVGDIRTVVSAQAAYASANGGYYDKCECLAQPQRCIPGYGTSSPVMLDAALANTGPRRGYEFELHLGPAAPVDSAGAVSPSSVTSFAYVAVPMQAGRTGIRSFCGDAGGLVRLSPDGDAPTIVDGKCPEDWKILH